MSWFAVLASRRLFSGPMSPADNNALNDIGCGIARMPNNTITHHDRFMTVEQGKLNRDMIGMPTLVRWYIDTRSWEAKGLDLPFIHTLTQSDQESVKRYYHHADRRMSVASQLLKYFFIHQVTGVPWGDIEIQRSPPPENRPFYDATMDFNISHQAGITVLTGTRAADNGRFWSKYGPRVGVDISCVDEPSRRRIDAPPKTLASLATHAEIYESALSAGELEAIKNPFKTLQLAHQRGLTNIDPSDHKEEELAGFGMRLFFAIWALKEAYLKMTGDGLIAPWIKELEFTNVIPPKPVYQRGYPLSRNDPRRHDYAAHTAFRISPSVQNWGPTCNDIKITLKGESVNHVRLQLVAFEEDYFVATAASGSIVGPVSNEIVNENNHHLPGYINIIHHQNGMKDIRIPPVAGRKIGDQDPWRVESAITDPWLPMQEVDLEADIRQCAEGRCSHPEGTRSIFTDTGVQTSSLFNST